MLHSDDQYSFWRSRRRRRLRNYSPAVSRMAVSLSLSTRLQLPRLKYNSMCSILISTDRFRWRRGEIFQRVKCWYHAFAVADLVVRRTYLCVSIAEKADIKIVDHLPYNPVRNAT